MGEIDSQQRALYQEQPIANRAAGGDDVIVPVPVTGREAHPYTMPVGRGQ
jgi:hypothetical protein